MQNFSVAIESPTDYPNDGKIIIKVKDGLNNIQEIELELSPPAVKIDNIYTIGSAGITVGATEDIYIQLNAIGGVGDINTIQAQLVQGICNATTNNSTVLC